MEFGRNEGKFREILGEKIFKFIFQAIFFQVIFSLSVPIPKQFLKIYFERVRIEDGFAISREKVTEMWKGYLHPHIISRLFALFSPKVPDHCLVTPFAVFLGSLYRGSDSDRLDTLFQILDYDGDGFISAGDISRYFRLLFESVSKSHGIGADADIPFEIERTPHASVSLNDSVDFTDEDLSISDSERKEEEPGYDDTPARLSLFKEMESIFDNFFPPLPSLPPMDTKGYHSFILKQKLHRAFAFGKRPTAMKTQVNLSPLSPGPQNLPSLQEELASRSPPPQNPLVSPRKTGPLGESSDNHHMKKKVKKFTKKIINAPEKLLSRVVGDEKKGGEEEVCVRETCDVFVTIQLY